MKTHSTAMKDAFERAFHRAINADPIQQPALLKRVARVFDRQGRRGAR